MSGGLLRLYGLSGELTVPVATVPEPHSILVLGVAVGALGYWGRCQRTRGSG
jgi:hypothetical protein